MSWAHPERTGKKALNQEFELREAPLGLPVPHKGGTGVNKDPYAEPPRRLVRGQRDNGDRGEFGRRERQEKFRRYPLCSVKPVSDLSTIAVEETLVVLPSTLEKRITTDDPGGSCCVRYALCCKTR